MISKLLILAISIITAATAQIFLKKGILILGALNFSLKSIFFLIPKILKNSWLVGGILLYGLSFLPYIFVLSNLQLSIVYPISVSAGIILISIASRLLFKELLNLFQITGISLMIFGIFLLVIKS